MRVKSLVLGLSLLLFMPIPAVADNVITINLARSPLFGFTGLLQQSYILIDEVENPIACLVISPGGRGRLFVADGQLSINSTNFLVRSRHLFAAEGYESPTISCVENTRGVSIADLNEELSGQWAMISNGYGVLKEKTFRIAHMGDTQEWEIRGLLATIDRILGLE